MVAAGDLMSTVLCGLMPRAIDAFINQTVVVRYPTSLIHGISPCARALEFLNMWLRDAQKALAAMTPKMLQQWYES